MRIRGVALMAVILTLITGCLSIGEELLDTKGIKEATEKLLELEPGSEKEALQARILLAGDSAAVKIYQIFEDSKAFEDFQMTFTGVLWEIWENSDREAFWSEIPAPIQKKDVSELGKLSEEQQAEFWRLLPVVFATRMAMTKAEFKAPQFCPFDP